MAEPLISRVYEVKVASLEDSQEKVQALTDAFKRMDQAKIKLNASLQEKISINDQDAVSLLIKKIKDLETEMAKLNSQRDTAAKETSLLAKAEKESASALLIKEKAVVAVATAEKIRSQTRIAENKELQRQIDIENKQRQNLEAEKKAVDALEGSYLKLKAQRQALERLTGSANQSSTISFQGQSFNFDEAIAKIRQMKAEESDYTEKLRLEKVIHEDIIKTQQQEIISIQKQRVELETLVTDSKQSSNISFGGKSFTNDQAVSQIQELRSQEQLLTEQLNNEKSIRQSMHLVEEQKLNDIKQERIELEKIVSTSSKTSSISFKGQSFNFDEAIAKSQQLKAIELEYTEKLKIEKAVHDQIIHSQEQSLITLRQERTELESLVNKSGQTSTVSFQGNNLSIDEAISKAHQLEQAENLLTQKLLTQQNELRQLPQNYYTLVAAQKQALELYKITPSTSPFFQEVKQGAIDATSKVQAFNRTLSPDGTLVGEYKSGIINAFKELGLSDVLKKQRDEINGNLNKLKKESQDLAAEYRKTGTAGTESFSKIDQQLRLNVEQQEHMKKSLLSLDSALNNTGSIGGQISTGIANGFKNARLQLSQLLLGYVGFQAVFSGLQSGVGITKDLSDQTTNLEIELGKTKGGVDGLVQSLSQVKTRTTLQGLEEIANVAAKAGVAEKDLLGVTQSIDKVKVAFGKDFGDVQEGTDTFAKLISIFFDDHEITGERILKIGNSIRTLANETVASVPFINDFAGRMAGLKQISAISLPDIIGLGAGFEQFKQSAEVSSTALVRVIPKIAGDIEKFSKVAGLTAENFSKLINTNPAEALLKVSEGLVKNKSGIEEVSAALADAGLPAARITTILATLGGKADVFRERIKRAGETINDTSNIEDSFARKNENLAGTLDRISKKFADAANSKAFQLTVSGIAVVITFLIGNLPIVLALFGLLAASWAVQNTALIALRLQLIGYNLLIGASAIAQGVLTVVNGIYIAGLFLLNGAYAIVTRAAAIFNITLGRTPLGLILTGLALAISAYKAFGEGLNNSAIGLRSVNEEARINRDVIREAAKATSEQRAEASLLVRVVKDLSISEATRLATLNKLIAIDPAFQSALVDGKINYQKLDEALISYNNNLIRSSELEAAKTRNTKEFAALTELQIKKQNIEFAKSTRDFTTLTEEEIKLVAAAAIKSRGLVDNIIPADASKAIDQLNTQIDKQTKVIDAAQSVFNSKQKAIDDDIAKRNADAAKLAGNATVKIKPFEIDVDALKKDISKYDEQINAFKGSQKELEKLIEERKKLQEKLDAALGTQKKVPASRGSRIPGDDLDKLRDIDAAANEERINLEKAFLKREELVRKDGSRILVNNEITYLNELLRINETAIKNKLSKLDDSNAAERLKRSELNVELIKDQKETDKQIFDIKKKELDVELESIKKQSEIQLSKVTDDPTKTSQEKRKATEEFLTQRYIIQLLYNQRIATLENVYNQRSVENLQKRSDELLTIERETNKVHLEITVGTLEEIDTETEKAITKIKLKYDKLREEILKSNKSSGDKQAAITIITKVENVETSATQLSGPKNKSTPTGDLDKLEAARKLFEAGLITAKQFEEIYAKAIKGQEDLNDAVEAGKKQITSFKDLLGNSLGKLFGFAEGSDKAKLLGQTITQAFDTASNAMNSFFDAEKNRIEQSNRVAQKRLDIELQQAKDRSQSQAESDSLDRQFAAKKEAEDRKAFEKNKKLQIQQAGINLAIQLSNLAVIAFAPNPLNIATLGIAGAIQYAIQAALALANFALNVRRISSAQFAGGGKVVPEELKNGRITARANIPERPNGDNIFATVRVGEVILNEEQQKKLGGARTFRAIGVPGFATGGITTRNHTYTKTEIEQEARYRNVRAFASGGFTGLGDFPLGDNLRPPINPSSFLNPSSAIARENKEQIKQNSDQLNELLKMVASTSAAIVETSRQTNQRIDNIKVQVVTNDITNSQNKIKRVSAIGTLSQKDNR